MKSLLSIAITGMVLGSALGAVAFSFYALVHFALKYW